MCTRIYIEADLHRSLEPVQWSPLALLMQEVFDKRVTISGEVRPSDMAAVIASNKRGVRGIFPMIWGFSNSPTHHTNTSSNTANSGSNTASAEKKRPVPIVNCRVETAATKDLWRDSWFHHRCIIPASYYFEWGASINPTDASPGPASPGPLLDALHPADGRVIIGSSSGRSSTVDNSTFSVDNKPFTMDNNTSTVDNRRSIMNESDGSVDKSDGSVNKRSVKRKTQKTKKAKYAIQPENELITYLAGLYRMENGYPHFAVLTREPADSIRFIHNRMPVILKTEQIDDWINPEAKPEEIIQEAITEMEYMPIS